MALILVKHAPYAALHILPWLRQGGICCPEWKAEIGKLVVLMLALDRLIIANKESVLHLFQLPGNTPLPKVSEKSLLIIAS